MKPQWSRPTCGLIAALTALGTLAGAPTPTRATTTPLPSPSIHDGDATRATGTLRAVTLVTGDRVTVFPSGGYSMTHGPGRTEVSFFTEYTAGHLSVVPSDAAKLVRAGRLDERLFNITDLIEQGYDDQRTELPLIVITEDRGKAFAGARARFSPSTTAQIRELPELNAIALHERRVAATKFWKKLTSGRDARDRTLSPGIAQVWLDGIRKPSLDESVPQIGAPAMWRAGYTGKGVTVAVLDTGVDPSHPDLAGRVAVSESHLDDEDETDFVGHGTHVASIIAGSGAASDGRYRGVAPEARLVAGKVCAVRGCPESAILTGMRWAAGDQHATVVNLSLGGPDSPGLDPLEQAVEILTARYGTLFVVAAGNSGKDRSVNSPASAPSTLAVGAIDSSDALAYFSSRGPLLDEDGLKPDITAPGVNIMAARGPSSGLPGMLYTELSGTSMATPHVAGAAALLAQQHPDWAAQDLKATLMASATPNSSVGVYAQGAGQVDLVRALKTSVTPQPASISFGRIHYPHDDDRQISALVSYHNSGSEEVTLNLVVSAALDVTADLARTPAPQEMFRLSSETVTVPAGRDASVEIIADTSVNSPNGYVGGYLTATGYGLVMRTPFAVNKEVESYDLTLTHLDWSGSRPYDYTTELVSVDGTRRFEAGLSRTGVATLRVPRDTYILTSNITQNEPTSYTLLVQPRFEVTADQSLVLDARIGAPVTVGVSIPGVTPYGVLEVGWSQETPTGPVASSLGGRGRLFTGRLGPPGVVPGFASQVTDQWNGEPTDPERPEPGPSVNLCWYIDGRMITGFHRTVPTANLAVVHSRRASAMPFSRVTSGAIAHHPSRAFRAVFDPEALFPGSGTDYYNTDGGVEWIPFVVEALQTGWLEHITFVEGPSLRFEAGHSYEIAQNFGVFGPTMAQSNLSDTGVWRTDDTLHVRIPMFGDGAGNQGYSTVSAAETILTANGARIAATTATGEGDFTVPAGPQRYQLTASVRREHPFELSTQVTGTWTFRSAQTPSATALPLWTIGFAPRLDDTNTVVAGKELIVPLRVESQPGAEVGTLGTVTVDVSFDDGATWTELPVRSAGGLSTVALRVPRGSGFVSLRANAADSRGNTVEETIIHAYRYRSESRWARG